MEITKQQVEKILKTLPIGYYIKRNVDIILSDEDSSYYNPMTDTITISYKMIEKVMNKLSDTEDLEKSIRCLLYHETSHAFLTPHDLKITSIVNVFEDERIESILRTYYTNVDFRTFVKTVNNFHNEPPKSAFELYYQIVRYRIGPTKFLKAVHRLINKFKYIEYNTLYIDAINDLYKKIEDYWHDFTSKYDSKTLSDEELNNALLDNEVNDKIYTSDTDADIDKCEDIDKTSIINDINNEKNDITKTEETEQTNADAAIKHITDKYISDDVLNNVFEILAKYRCITKQNGSAINAYSGIFDSRSVIRNDYKYFVQQNRLSHAKAFSKLHLNLFIDCSGSFYSSNDTINKILYALTKFEKQNKNFTFDMIACGMSERLLPKDKRIQKSISGNKLDKKIFEIFNRQQFVDCQNINIVCFDGDAFSDFYYHERLDAYKNMLAFDTNNTTIISDSDNTTALDYCKHAKVIITDDYTNNLYQHIIMALKQFVK